VQQKKAKIWAKSTVSPRLYTVYPLRPCLTFSATYM
jgi:hypothetical protein